MGWIDLVWPTVAAVCLTLGLIYLLVWFRRPDQLSYLAFFATAAAVAVFSTFELRMIRTPTAGEYAVALRWAHLPLFALFLSIVAFVHLYFRTGKLWLGLTACGLRVLVLLLNFTSGVNVNFEQVTAMRPATLLGALVYLPVGVANPFAVIAQLSNVLLLWFVTDASIALWRTGAVGARRRAAIVGGSLFFCILATGIVAGLLNGGLIQIPVSLSVGFLVVVVAMAFELGWDVIAAASLAERLRQNEEKLRESEQRLQLAADAGELALWEWNIVADQVWMTREGRALFGYRADEPLSLRRFLDSVHPEDRAAVEHAVRASLAAEGLDFEHDFRIVLGDGRVRWVTSRGRIERERSSAASRMRGVTHDITARRQAEERFRTLVEAAPSAMLVVDTAGLVVLANGRAETTFGYPRDALIGRSIEMLVPQRSHAAHRVHRQAYARDMQPRAMGAGRELFAVCSDGTELPVEVGLNPMQTSEGMFVLASVVDVRARKQAELEAALQRDEMAHLARVAMLGELSGSLAHELNQPLAAILSNAQAAQRFLSRDPPQIDRVTEILADIVKNDRRAGDVITRLRAMLKKEEARYQSVDLNQLVLEVLAFMRSDLLSRQVSVHAELAPHLPEVTGDRVQIQQVLVNLLLNGCDAMADCSPPRNLVVRSKTTPERAVVLSVVDHGVGIPTQKLERIFDPFVTTKPQGLGLGLAVCQSIVKAHGGRLWATNNATVGATLHVEFPDVTKS
ncbi:MAG: PAS domain S-box protein [Burkholderiales bacterium]